MADHGLVTKVYHFCYGLQLHRQAQARTPAGGARFSHAMQDLGVEQVFSRSPQAKGRAGRMPGTFQDQLVSELRLVGTTTIDQASAVLQDFLPRFNQQFRVPAQQAQSAYRSLDSSISLERTTYLLSGRAHARLVAKVVMPVPPSG